MNLNKVMLIGNVTRDPEVRTTPTGQNVATIGIATNRRWKNQSGQQQDQVEYHTVVAWRRLAEIVGQYLKKGSKVYIEGRLQTRSWDDQSGVKRYRTEIIAENMIMLDRPGAGAAAPSSKNAPAAAEGAQPEPAGSGEPEINVEDIPF
ncbi:MAG: single-stranded DNA-binding protein [Patescibacteria group bacterium]|nr:single-stranded DNA-binding protein [Patescibacteria group bacterium]MDD5715817.1 single-stranded DNA-binding protein [Patescibacteria group bacterium]